MTDSQQHWSIGEVARRVGLDADTLRYYERTGVLPPPGRDGGGRRVYTKDDIELIEMLVHLRNTGMPLAAIGEFTAPDADERRLALLVSHRAAILEQRAGLDTSLDVISRKIAAYSEPNEPGVRELERPDATLAYEVTGCGPLLFLVGAPVGRTGFNELATALSRRYTVVSHDPRGIGASALSPYAAGPTPEVLADDLTALVRHLTDRPAQFFGASGGAVTVLELVTRLPELVDVAVLHEPPLVRLLGDRTLEARAAAAFGVAHHDPQQATQQFIDLTGAGHDTGPGERPPSHTPLPPLPEADLDRNRYFLGQMAGPTVFYQPELSTPSANRVVVCAGERSHGQLARRTSQALADRLALPLTELPGGHLAPSTEPIAFAAALASVLDDRP